jgi:hypothetical protein
VSRYPSEQDIRAALGRVPEVALAHESEPIQSGKEARRQLEKQVKRIHKQTESDPDAFVKDLERTRADLAGLPFLKGKDCRRGATEAKQWNALSASIRLALASAGRSFRSASSSTAFEPSPDLGRFWASLERTKALLETKEAIPALRQTLEAEHPWLRSSLVEHLAKTKSSSATVALARRAVFDLDPGIREWALVALKERPASDYAPVFREALRYPWLPVVENAAEAVVRLRLKDAVPLLVAMLDEPDPDAPFLGKAYGKTVPLMRELVRINHLSNCLLCHARSLDRKEPVRGLIPVSGEPIPQTAYYSERRGGEFVRADITYLRQDFSVTLPVAKSDPWPTRQRYDFLVRTRPLTEKERVEWEARKANPPAEALSEHKRAILSALQGLTGEYAGTTGDQWRELLREIGTGQAAALEVPSRFGWRSRCAK